MLRILKKFIFFLYIISNKQCQQTVSADSLIVVVLALCIDFKLVLYEPGGCAFAFLLWPDRGEFERLTCPHREEFTTFLKKMEMPGGWSGGEGGGEMETAGND